MREFANFSAEGCPLQLAGRTALAMASAGVLAFLAPFGTYRYETIGRIGYWTVEMAAWLVLSQAAAWLVWWMPAMRERGRVARGILATVIATAPMLLLTGIANNVMDGWLPHPANVVELMFAILLIGGVFTYLSDGVVRRLAEVGISSTAGSAEETTHEVLATEPNPTDTAFIDRIPPHIRGRDPLYAGRGPLRPGALQRR